MSTSLGRDMKCDNAILLFDGDKMIREFRGDEVIERLSLVVVVFAEVVRCPIERSLPRVLQRLFEL